MRLISASHSELARAAALDTVATTAALLFENGQTTERVAVTAERLGRAFGLALTLHPHWGELALQVEGTPFSEMVPAMPRNVDMGKVLAIMTVVDDICDGTLPHAAARSVLETVEWQRPVSTPRFTLFAAIAGVAMGVIFGALDATSLVLIALSAGLAALVRRRLARQGGGPFVQPLCAAFIAGLIGAIATRLSLSDSQVLVALCPCMVLVPGPHLLNGAIDLARMRITLGVARLVYAGLIILMICAGLLLGLAAGGTVLPNVGMSGQVPFFADVIAAGCAVAGYGTFFSMPWKLLPIPIAVGMLAHAARWALISLAGAHVAVGAFGACLLVGVIITPVSDRFRLPFAALGFSAVVSMVPGFYIFQTSSALLQLISMGPDASPDLLMSAVANGTTAFLIVVAIAFGLILPRMLFEHFLPVSERPQQMAAVPATPHHTN